jgi:hypothetical protein
VDDITTVDDDASIEGDAVMDNAYAAVLKGS